MAGMVVVIFLVVFFLGVGFFFFGATTFFLVGAALTFSTFLTVVFLGFFLGDLSSSAGADSEVKDSADSARLNMLTTEEVEGAT